jgi:hypothetical protein
MAAIYSNGGNRWTILGFNFTKRDALSSVYKISMTCIRQKHKIADKIAGVNRASWPILNGNILFYFPI